MAAFGNRDRLLSVKPKELTFSFELRKRASCTIQLSNSTRRPVAFKVMNTNPGNYCARPKNGIVWPRSTCDITVQMQGPTEALTEVECKDKFQIKSVIAPADITLENVWKLFKEPGHLAGEDINLRVKYIFPPQTESSNSERARAATPLNTSSRCRPQHPQTESSNSERARAPAPLNTSSSHRPQHPQVIPAQDDDLLQNVIKFGLLGLAIWFLITKLLPLIWTLMFFLLMLGIKMINRIVSDSVEDWILKILCYVFGHYISRLFSS